MNSHSSLDGESFQSVLANAFAIQESGLETRSLSACVELQRMIGASHADLDLAMQLITERTCAFANASGVAIALLQRDQLVYRAASGSAARNMGHHLTAVLSVSAQSHSRKEILRVEDAQTDTRIEGAICRQFGANALLIVPIYRERTLAGLLEVLFDEAHSFQDKEVRAYQLMAGLVGEALSAQLQAEEKKALARQPAPVPPSDSQIPPDAPMFTLLSKPEPSPWISRIYQRTRPMADIGMMSRFLRESKAFSFDNARWDLVAVPVLLVLVISSWVAYDRHRPSRFDSPQRVANVAEPMPPAISKPQTSSDQPPSTPPQSVASPAASPFKRIRVGKNETDYVADDVTIRHFTHDDAALQVHPWHHQVDIGEDVTVHYFASTSGSGAQLQPASAVQSSSDRPLRQSK